MSLKTRWIDFLYRVATGSQKFRNLLTPVGAIFFGLFTMLFVVAALLVDIFLHLPKLFPKPLNIALSLPVILLGLFLMGWSAFQFLKVKGTPVPFNPPPGLVTSGPFAFVRNPMITGIFIMLLGLGILLRSVSLVFLFTPLFIFFNVWQLKAIEEPELVKRLGSKYIEYRERTPMFIPAFKLRPKREIEGKKIMLRPCDDKDFDSIYAIINEAARVYRGVIPEDRWKEPYMSRDELRHEIDEGVVFWGYQEGAQLVGVMGIQHVQDVTLIRHAYIRPANQNQGIGGKLLSELRTQTDHRILIGTWAAAVWAIRFYEKNGFRMVSPKEKDRLLKKYWSIPERQVETSVVLADQMKDKKATS